MMEDLLLSDHPAQWELDWIDDPKNHHYYRDEEHRKLVKAAIILRTSFRALNFDGIEIVSTENQLQPGMVFGKRIAKLFKFKGGFFCVKGMVIFEDINFHDFPKKEMFINSTTREIHDLLLKELGGRVFPSASRPYSLFIANVINDIPVAYNLTRLF